MPLAFIEGCMFCRNQSEVAEAPLILPAEESESVFVSFFRSLNNFFGNGFAVLNEEDAKKAESKHNRAVNKQ